MKMISKIARIGLGLVLAGSSVFAQSLADAKRAIDAEQYQKAKGMLKNLTVTQATNDENYFYLGWVYLLQDYTDSAKTTFTKGIAANQKSAINYAGLGVVSHLTNDAAGKTANFNQVAALTGKKDSKPWLYMAEGLLMPLPGSTVANTADVEAARVALEKAKLANPKDIDVFITLGNAYTAQKNTTDAYKNYNDALAIDPKSPAANVAQGIQWKNAHSFEDAIKQFQMAIANDANYGPAYREWAETDLLWSRESRAVASEKIQEGVEKYAKYLSLTDESEENLMRYADFLISAGRYPELQEVATKLSKSSTTNPRVYRYIAYAAFENKRYTEGNDAMRNWFSKAEPRRILPRDYYYRGQLQLAGTKDTVAGITDLKKAASLDSTLADKAYPEIVEIYRKQKNYIDAANSFMEHAKAFRSRAMLTQRINAGIYYYFAFSQKKDSTLLVKADSALNYVIRTATAPVADAYIYKARVADLRDNSTELDKMVGFAKPYYEKFIEILVAKPSTDARQIKNLSEAYAYMGNYYLYHDKDEAKATEMYTKAKEQDPANKQADYFFNTYKKAAAPTAAPKKPTK